MILQKKRDKIGNIFLIKKKNNIVSYFSQPRRQETSKMLLRFEIQLFSVIKRNVPTSYKKKTY